jgi:hypothetical protein
MNRTILFTPLALLSLFSSPLTRAEEKPALLPQWKSLFNGKDLTGWTDVNTTP